MKKNNIKASELFEGKVGKCQPRAKQLALLRDGNPEAAQGVDFECILVPNNVAVENYGEHIAHGGEYVVRGEQGPRHCKGYSEVDFRERYRSTLFPESEAVPGDGQLEVLKQEFHEYILTMDKKLTGMQGQINKLFAVVRPDSTPKPEVAPQPIVNSNRLQVVAPEHEYASGQAADVATVYLRGFLPDDQQDFYIDSQGIVSLFHKGHLKGRQGIGPESEGKKHGDIRVRHHDLMDWALKFKNDTHQFKKYVNRSLGQRRRNKGNS